MKIVDLHHSEYSHFNFVRRVKFVAFCRMFSCMCIFLPVDLTKIDSISCIFLRIDFLVEINMLHVISRSWKSKSNKKRRKRNKQTEAENSREKKKFFAVFFFFNLRRGLTQWIHRNRNINCIWLHATRSHYRLMRIEAADFETQCEMLSNAICPWRQHKIVQMPPVDVCVSRVYSNITTIISITFSTWANGA